MDFRPIGNSLFNLLSTGIAIPEEPRQMRGPVQHWLLEGKIDE
jgi:hypothetical protein